jgi:hypothetical protein
MSKVTLDDVSININACTRSGVWFPAELNASAIEWSLQHGTSMRDQVS